jgi:hypothetical protein
MDGNNTMENGQQTCSSTLGAREWHLLYNTIVFIAGISVFGDLGLLDFAET